jgi:hypothetical protein
MMRYFVPGWRKELGPQKYGLFVSPKMPCAYARLADFDWIGDCQVFTGRFDEARWKAWLHKCVPYRATCKGIIAPDVVGDAAATLERFALYAPLIRSLGFLVALAAHDGLDPSGLDWPMDDDDEYATDWIGENCEGEDDLAYHAAVQAYAQDGQPFAFDAVCLGGTTAWKLGAGALATLRRAKTRHLHVHALRVNSGKRFKHFDLAGADSCDGTAICFAGRGRIEQIVAQPALPIFAS